MTYGLEAGATRRPPLAELNEIRKTYGGIVALDRVNFACSEGEIHAIAGENGAGKSTLISILGGIQLPDSGTVRLRGRLVNLHSPADAARAGIAVMHQELSLIEDLDVAENVLLHREPRQLGFVLDSRRLYARTAELLDEYGIAIDPRAPVRQLSIADRQLVELAHAFAQDASLLLLDEPTSSLTAFDQARLFRILNSLRRSGRSIIYISHRLEEIFELADRVTVLRDGNVVTTLDVASTNEAELVRSMVGRDLASHMYPERPEAPRTMLEPVLQVRDCSSPEGLQGITFTVRPGEIVGIGGLVGSGRTSLMLALFGADPDASGEISIAGQHRALRSPRHAIEAGVAFVGEDRQRDSLGIDLDVLANLSAVSLPTRGPVIDRQQMVSEATAVADRVRLRGGIRQPVRELSGGNQQKVAVGKWLKRRPTVLLLDEPTRGIDVGAKHEIYGLLRELASQGTALVVVSSEMSELLGLCDRILVMHEGSLVADLDAVSATEEAILLAASGLRTSSEQESPDNDAVGQARA